MRCFEKFYRYRNFVYAILSGESHLYFEHVHIDDCCFTLSISRLDLVLGVLDINRVVPGCILPRG